MAFVTKTLRLTVVANENTNIEKVRVTTFGEQYFNEHVSDLTLLVEVRSHKLSKIEYTPINFRGEDVNGFLLEYTLNVETLSSDTANKILESIFPADRELQMYKGRRTIQVIKVEVF
jgi:hypothetical protein